MPSRSRPFRPLRRAWIVVLLGIGPALLAAEEASELNGFALTKLRVPASQIIAGGPPRDGIHSVDAPEFATAGKATWIGGDTDLLAVEIDGQAHAYPIRMLEFHQVVNDELAGKPIVATYDPLTGTAFVYRRDVAGKTLTFGVSGLLYNHNFLLYDRQTESLWSQFLGEAIAGPLSGTKLTRVPSRQTIPLAWLQRQPATEFLRHPDPEHIEYHLISPYQEYMVQDKTIFPVAASDPRYHAKELVLGLSAGGVQRAYLGSVVTRAGSSVDDELAGRKVHVDYQTETGTFEWDVPDDVEVVEAYWFAWKAFHPDTQIFGDEGTAPKASDGD